MLGEVIAPKQAARERQRIGLGHGAAVQADLLLGVALLRPQVLPVDRHQPLAGQEPQPQEQRHGRIGQVLVQLPRGVEIRLLEHVGGIDPARHAAVHAAVGPCGGAGRGGP